MSEIKFNREQQQAIDFKDGACSVIAAAGSGKSTVLLNRIKKLVEDHGVFERDILAITFTRNTGDELTQKLKKMGFYHVNVGTFHSICAQILQREGMNITHNLVQEWQIDNCFRNIDQNADTKEIMNFISYQKNYMRTPDDEFVPKNSLYSENQLRTFYKAYENMKRKEGLYDFEDYLLLCLEVLQANPGKYTYEYILVDEHQDSNKIQNMLLKEWCKSGNIFVVHDYRQAIYGFRGGTTEYSMNFEKYWDNATVINMYTNYRSPKNIVEKANHFIKHYYGDYKHYVDAKAHNQEDGHIQVNSRYTREAEAIEVVNEIQKLINNGEKLNEIAVLYRNNKHADFVENELKRRGIEYDIANDSSFFKRKEIAGILSFLRLVKDTDDDNAFEGIFKFRTYPLMYFSNQLLGKMRKYANKEGVSLFEALQKIDYSKPWHKNSVQTFVKNIERLQNMLDEDEHVITLIDEVVKSFKIIEHIENNYKNMEEREERLNSIEVLKSFVKNNDLDQFLKYVYTNTDKKKSKKDAVKLMTIHRSKGLEFNNVFVIGIQDGEFPNDREGVENDILEEARLFYVAVTRSKKNLWLSEIGQNNRFIREYGEVEKPIHTIDENDVLVRINDKLSVF